MNEGPSWVRNRFSLEASRMLEELSRATNQLAITMLLHEEGLEPSCNICNICSLSLFISIKTS